MNEIKNKKSRSEILSINHENEFDDLRVVFQILRHDCAHIKSASKARNLIIEKSGLSRERVTKILFQIAKT